MPSIYKVWVHIEEIDEERDHYEDLDMPDSLGVFDTPDEAREFIATLPGIDWAQDQA